MVKQKKTLKKIASFLLIFAMVLSMMPQFAFATDGEMSGTELPGYIFSETWNKTYDVLYHEADEIYTYQGQEVTFPDESHVQVGDQQVREIKNRVVQITVDTDGEEGTAEISFSGVKNPVSYVTGLWNPSSGGGANISYTLTEANDKKISTPLTACKAERDITEKLTLTGLRRGTYHLTDGIVHEEANEWSPGLDFNDGESTVKSRDFGYLPDISFEIGAEEGDAAVETLINKISALPAVTALEISDRDTVYSVRNAYELLSEEQKEKVTNIADLEAAEAKILELLNRRFEDGTYQGTGTGRNGEMTLSVTIENCSIKSIDEISQNETENYWERAKSLFGKIIDRQDTDVDSVASATKSSEGIRNAVKDALEKAKIKEDPSIGDSGNTEGPDKEPGTEPDVGDVPAEDVYLGEKTEAKVYDDFENDIWLQYQQKDMEVGGTADLYPWRLHQIVTDVINNDVARPDFHFEIISGDSITLSTDKSNDKTIVTGVKPGTSVVKVTYDAMDYKDRHWNAISLVNTAYAVFTVGEEGSAQIKTNDEFANWRHYDTIYYKEGTTTPYTFTVDTTNAESIKVTLNGIEIQGKGNKYTANLENRSNIIGIEAKDSDGKVKSMYRVIDARFMEVNVENKSFPGKQLGAGDTANISFRGITLPIYKLATIYNPCSNGFGEESTYVEYKNAALNETFKGKCKQWDLATKNDFDVTFPEEGEYLFQSDHGIRCS